MFNVGAGEMLVILLLALIVLGPDKLPSAARQAGKYLSEFRRMSDGFQRELRDAMDLDGTKPQSGTMAPVDTSATSASEGESHRVIESANGPTLPPVMAPTAVPDAATSSVGAHPVPSPSATADPSSPGPVGPAVVRVDGPTTSFD